jgi:phosphoribosylformylglycinamidine synthase
VYECAANLACVGAEPLGLTNCLNFGNPEKPHVAWQLTEAVAGLVWACSSLGVPVVGGNVSLYNEGPAGPIFPTPVIGMVGKLPDAAHAGRLGFFQEGDAVALVGSMDGFSAVGSELSKLRGAAPKGALPPIPESVPAAFEAIRQGVRSGRFHSAHDVAEGGLAVALAECCVAGGIGAQVSLDGMELFDEAPGRCFVVSGAPEVLAGCRVIGRVGGDSLDISGALSVSVSELRVAASGGLEQALGTPLLG